MAGDFSQAAEMERRAQVAAREWAHVHARMLEFASRAKAGELSREQYDHALSHYNERKRVYQAFLDERGDFYRQNSHLAPADLIEPPSSGTKEHSGSGGFSVRGETRRPADSGAAHIPPEPYGPAALAPVIAVEVPGPNSDTSLFEADAPKKPQRASRLPRENDADGHPKSSKLAIAILIFLVIAVLVAGAAAAILLTRDPKAQSVGSNMPSTPQTPTKTAPKPKDQFVKIAPQKAPLPAHKTVHKKKG